MVSNTNNVYGGKGFRLLENGFTPQDEVFFLLVFLDDTVITITENLLGGEGLTSESIPAGTYLYGVFDPSSITVTSGRAIAYIK